MRWKIQLIFQFLPPPLQIATTPRIRLCGSIFFSSPPLGAIVDGGIGLLGTISYKSLMALKYELGRSTQNTSLEYTARTMYTYIYTYAQSVPIR
jgi:hypothetical protein